MNNKAEKALLISLGLSVIDHTSLEKDVCRWGPWAQHLQQGPSRLSWREKPTPNQQEDLGGDQKLADSPKSAKTVLLLQRPRHGTEVVKGEGVERKGLYPCPPGLKCFCRAGTMTVPFQMWERAHGLTTGTHFSKCHVSARLGEAPTTPAPDYRSKGV